MIDPRQACEPCWIRQARRTQAMFTYDDTPYCRACLAIDGIDENECALISIPVEKREVHQPESEAPMPATAATAPARKPRRGQRFCKCNCGEICGTKFGYVPGHEPADREREEARRERNEEKAGDREKIKQHALVLRSQGMSTRAIAKELGIDKSLAHRLISQDRTSRTVRSVKKRHAPKPLAFSEPIHGHHLDHVEVKVSPAFLDRWFLELSTAEKVKIFNREQVF